jgi:cytochrome c5
MNDRIPRATLAGTFAAAGIALAAVALAVAPHAMAQTEGKKAPKTGEQVYNEACMACHATGVASAPKFRDRQAWAPLIAEGQHVLTGHAWVGVRAMPAKGGKPDLKLAEFARAVVYMAGNAGANWTEPDAAMIRKIAKEAEERLEQQIREAQKMKKELQQLAK